MIKRRKPMARTEIKRTAPLRRTGGLSSSGPIKAKRRTSKVERDARDLLAKRAGGVCETQVPSHCTGIASLWSHRKRRSQSSKAEMWSVTNGLASCRSCELYLTDHGSDPKVRSLGWTVHPSVDPARVPVWRRGRYVWLCGDGSVEPLDLIELAELVVA